MQAVKSPSPALHHAESLTKLGKLRLVDYAQESQDTSIGVTSNSLNETAENRSSLCMGNYLYTFSFKTECKQETLKETLPCPRSRKINLLMFQEIKKYCCILHTRNTYICFIYTE